MISGRVGTIMAIVATRDLPVGAEVLVKYGYPPHVYTALHITHSDQQCSKVTKETSWWHWNRNTSSCRESVKISERNLKRKTMKWRILIYSDVVLFSPKKVREQCLIVTQFCIYFCFKQEFEKNKFLTLTIDILFIHMVFGYNLISLQIKYTII